MPRPAAADQLLHCPVGHRHQIHIALVLGLHALREKLAQTRARLARNLRGLGNPDKLLFRRAAQEDAPSETEPFPRASTACARLALSSRGPRARPASVMVRI